LSHVVLCLRGICLWVTFESCRPLSERNPPLSLVVLLVLSSSVGEESAFELLLLLSIVESCSFVSCLTLSEPAFDVCHECWSFCLLWRIFCVLILECRFLHRIFRVSSLFKSSLRSTQPMSAQMLHARGKNLQQNGNDINLFELIACIITLNV